jgi:microsomal dipeptidase-like Zn-dependent dipeptidase
VIADLHCHYAMHLLERVERPTLRSTAQRGISFSDRLRALVMWVANRVANYRTWRGNPRVTLEKLERGGVKLVLSVLLVPLDEMDLGQPYGAPPQPSYFDNLLEQMERVERELAQRDPAGTRHVIVKRARDLEDQTRIAFAHCVEGGFPLGTTPEEVKAHVGELADRGVLYITLAHLFWRQVATNSPALPFLSDAWYARIFPQPAGEGLTALGQAAVEAMYDHNVLIDLSHMRADSLTETLELLDRLDETRQFPVIATHAGVRFPESSQQYQLADETVRRIGERDGVVGLILAQHQLNDGIRKRPTRRLKQSVEVISRHIDRVEELAGPGHVGLGTDLDGFIKPAMAGLETAARLQHLRDPLLAKYDDDEAKVDGFLYDNAKRVIKRALTRREERG